MATKPLSRLDLNLLVALDALLSERSVTRAAERLGLSQPALSASLSRLRVHFDDPILVREGNNYVLSPLASRLVDQTAIALESARRVFAAHADFDASDSTREFTIYGSDYAFVTVGHRVSALASERAPGVRFRFNLHNPQFIEDAAHRLRTADAVLIPHGPVDNLPFLDLFSDGWIGIAASDNPLRRRQDHDGGRAVVAVGVHLPVAGGVHVGGTAAPGARGRAAHRGGRRGIPRDARVHRRHAAPRAGAEPARAVRRAASRGEGRRAPVRRRRRSARAVWWHPVHDRDPEHQWMRSLFAEVGRELSGA